MIVQWIEGNVVADGQGGGGERGLGGEDPLCPWRAKVLAEVIV